MKLQIIALLITFTGICHAQSTSNNPSPLHMEEALALADASHLNTKASVRTKTIVLRTRQLITQQLVYPKIAQENSIEGTVMIEVFISDQGKIKEATILDSPHVQLDKAISNSMKQITGTQVVDPQLARNLRIKVPIQFRLK